MKAHTSVRPLNTPKGNVSTWLRWLILPITSTCCLSPALAQTRTGKEKPIEEIIVTAQKREERLQDVPIAISVLSGDDLDSSTVQGISEGLSEVPGVVNFPGSRTPGHSSWVMRGVTAGQGLSGASPIGYYLDSIPYGLVKTTTTPDASPYDLDRVEVLRGPQGTLYGASSTNGVIRILTKDADLSDLEFKGRASASSTDHGDESYRGDLAVNVPLVEGKLAARAVLGYQDVGGWIDKPNDEDANDALIKTGRLKLNAQPSDALSIRLSAWFSRGEYGAPNLSADGYQTPTVRPEPSISDYDAYNAALDYQFPGVSLTSATSYLDFSGRLLLDFFVLLQGNEGFSEVISGGKLFSQEINLASTHTGPWQWTLGGIFRDSRESYLLTFEPPFPVSSPLNRDEFESESFAIFGELRRLFGDGRFEVTAGVRYFEDEATDQDLICASDSQCLGPSSKTSHFDKVSPRVVLNWHPSTQATLYASYSEGFRSGLNQSGVVTRTAPFVPPAKPDNLKNYEMGVKTRLWDGRASVETAIYYMDWQDVQQILVLDIPGAFPVPAFTNTTSASGPGFELSAIVEPIVDLSLSASFAWNDLTINDDVISFGSVLYPKGTRLNFSPEINASLSVDYSLPLGGSGLNARLSAAASYVSKQTHTDPRFAGDNMLLARAGLAVESSDRWVATLFADNLFNKNYVVFHDPSLLPPQNIWDMRVRPRTIGLQIEYRY